MLHTAGQSRAQVNTGRQASLSVHTHRTSDLPGTLHGKAEAKPLQLPPSYSQSIAACQPSKATSTRLDSHIHRCMNYDDHLLFSLNLCSCPQLHAKYRTEGAASLKMKGTEKLTLTCAVADPGFPVGGRVDPLRGGVDLRRGCFSRKNWVP